MIAAVDRVVVRSLEAADTAVVVEVEVDSSGMVEVQGEAAGNAAGSSVEAEHSQAAGLLAGDPVVAGVAGVDLEADRIATRAAEEAEQTEDMTAAAAAAAETEEVQEEEAGNAAPSGEAVAGDLAAEVVEAQEGEAGNTAPPKLGSGASRSWTLFLQLLMPYSILQRRFDESIVESLSVTTICMPLAALRSS